MHNHMLMDSSFFFTFVALAIGFFMLFGTPIFLVYRKFRFHQESKDLASSSSSPPPSFVSSPSPSSSYSSSSPPSSVSSPSPSSSSSSSSTSSLSSKWTHDVFPSFRGEDVRRNFLSHIQKEFRRKGITPFIDNNIKRGQSIAPELIQAIRNSKIAVVLLSRNYASSKWCLEELAEIMECKKNLGQTVFAIFYEIDPSDVKKLTGEFGAIFKKTCEGKTKEDVERWRQAFAEVATIAGYDSRNWDNEAVMIEKIVTEIYKRLFSSTPPRYMESLVGMGAHMEKMKSLLFLGSSEVRTVGIWGPSGIGKTTIARVLHDQVFDAFQLSVIMPFESSYARSTCSDDHDQKLHFEQQFLSKLTNQGDIKIPHWGAARNFVMHKKVLVIFDGVEQLVQLLAMPEARYFGPGSRIIITTQNLRLLNAFEVEHIYQVDLPPNDEALQIFCINAFGQTSPKDGFKKLAWEVTNLAGRLPLGLRIMGSHFLGILSKQEWKAEMPRLRVRLDGGIGSILKFSYDALEKEDKDLFLCIACFFVDEGLYDYTLEDALKDKYSHVRQGLEVLVQRSLISRDQNHLMHNLLVQLGREIVHEEFPDEPGKRRFLVDPKEIFEVFADNTGSRSVIGINVKFSLITEDDQDINERAFENMPNLQFLRICYDSCYKRLRFPQGLTYLSPKLRTLHWADCPLKSLPFNFNPKFLVKISLEYSKLEKLWEGTHPLGSLKLMILNGSENLKELPDLSTATNLLKLSLIRCKSLMELPSSIGNAKNLGTLGVWKCSSLKELPSSIGNLINLRAIDLGGCLGLVKLPTEIGKLTNLQELGLRKCSSLVELPSIENLINLRQIDLRKCSRLVKLPSSIENLINLQKLDLKKCSSLVELPSSIGNIINLQQIDLRKCSSLKKLPSSIGILINLRAIDLGGCLGLVELPNEIGKLTNLQELGLRECSSLKELPSSIGNLINLLGIDLCNCSRLVDLPLEIGKLTNLQELDLRACSSLVKLPSSIGDLIHFKELCLTGLSSLVRLPSSIKNLTNLQKLNLLGCSNMKELPSTLENIINLERIELYGCSSLVELPSSIGDLTNLNSLDLGGCSNLVELPDSIGNLTNLNNLNFGGCSNLKELPSSVVSLTKLKSLKLKRCSSLKKLPFSIGSLTNLESLDLSKCSNLVELPSSIGSLTKLKVLNCKGCSSLVDFTFSIRNPTCLSLQKCSKLKEFDVTGCSQLRSFPQMSTNIRKLYLRGTFIQEVPLSIKSWIRLRDFSITYCEELKEFSYVFDIITELELNDEEMEEIPESVSGMTRLRRLVLNKCRKLVSLPKLPRTTSSLVARNCDSLERLGCSFPNPRVRLEFTNCLKLNQEARDIIQTYPPTGSAAILRGREVPACYTYRRSGDYVTVKLDDRCFPAFLTFRVCILLVNKDDKEAGDKDYMYVCPYVVARQSYRVLLQYDLDDPDSRTCLSPLLKEHLYTFDVGVSSVDSSELLFEFEKDNDEWEIAECGVREIYEEDSDVDDEW